MIQLIITTEDLEECRKAYAAAWLAADRQVSAYLPRVAPPGTRTREGLAAVLDLLGIEVAIQTGGDPAG